MMKTNSSILSISHVLCIRHVIQLVMKNLIEIELERNVKWTASESIAFVAS